MHAPASHASSTAIDAATATPDSTRLQVKDGHMKPIKVGLIGLGVVGAGTFKVLKRNQEEIRRRAGRGIEIAMVAVRSVERATPIVGNDIAIVTDPLEVINNPDIEIVVELIGGTSTAKDLVLG